MDLSLAFVYERLTFLRIHPKCLAECYSVIAEVDDVKNRLAGLKRTS